MIAFLREGFAFAALAAFSVSALLWLDVIARLA
jgi:hypothetical protein